MDLREVYVEIVTRADESRFRELMAAHHYLGDAAPRGETVRYVACHEGRWLALLMFSAAAIDGKTMRRSTDAKGEKTHIVGLVGHDTRATRGKKTVKKKGDGEEEKRTNEIGVAQAVLG